MQFPDTCDIHIMYLIWEEAVDSKPHHGYGKGVREKRDKERIGKGRDELRKNGWLVPRAEEFTTRRGYTRSSSVALVGKS